MDDLFNSCDIVMVCPHCGVKSQHKYLNKIQGRYEFEVSTISLPSKKSIQTRYNSNL